MPKFTIITPTFDNGPTLAYAIESVRRQTVSDYEHIIVGDGAVDSARKLAVSYATSDERVRFEDNPKGPSRGELHRDAAIRHSTGELICYLSDDDLWFDDHLETMQHLISDADFAHDMTVFAKADGSFGLSYADMSHPTYRERMLFGQNWVAPSTVVHTREAYLRLPQGWSTAPPDVYSDLFCWQQFLRTPDMRFACCGTVTALHPPAKDDAREPGEVARIRQLDGLFKTLRDPAAVPKLRQHFNDLLFQQAVDRNAESMHFQRRCEELTKSLDDPAIDRATDRATGPGADRGADPAADPVVDPEVDPAVDPAVESRRGPIGPVGALRMRKQMRRSDSG